MPQDQDSQQEETPNQDRTLRDSQGDGYAKSKQLWARFIRGEITSAELERLTKEMETPIMEDFYA